jgi:hypothetical protein
MLLINDARAFSPPSPEWYLEPGLQIPGSGPFHVAIRSWDPNGLLNAEDLAFVRYPSGEPVAATISRSTELLNRPDKPSMVLFEVLPAQPLADGATFDIIDSDGESLARYEGLPSLVVDQATQFMLPDAGPVSISTSWSRQTAEENCCERDCQPSMCENSMNGPCLECVPSRYEYIRTVAGSATGSSEGYPPFRFEWEWVARDSEGNETIGDRVSGDVDGACFRVDYIDLVTGERTEGEFECIDNPQWGSPPTEQPDGVIPDNQPALCFDQAAEADAGGSSGDTDAGLGLDADHSEFDSGSMTGGGPPSTGESGCVHGSGPGGSPLLLALALLAFRRRFPFGASA